METVYELATGPYILWWLIMLYSIPITLSHYTLFGYLSKLIIILNLGYCLSNEPAHTFVDIVILSAIVLLIIRLLGVHEYPRPKMRLSLDDSLLPAPILYTIMSGVSIIFHLLFLMFIRGFADIPVSP